MDAIVRVDDPPGWRLFGDPLRVIESNAPDRVAAVLDEAEGAARNRALYAVGFVAYEAGAAFGLAGHPAPPGLPLARFALYDPAAVRHVEAAPAGGPWTIGALAPSLDRAAFGAALDRIHRAIAEGDTYQVNFTFRLRGAFDGDPLGLFAESRGRPAGRLRRVPPRGALYGLLGVAGALLRARRPRRDGPADERHGPPRADGRGGPSRERRAGCVGQGARRERDDRGHGPQRSGARR